MDSPPGISQSTERSLGGVSPDWYCSGGGDREDELRKENQNLQQKIESYEITLKRKSEELNNVTKALHDERMFEEETLSNITQGSEKMLEQKGLQVQQLNNTVQKLHNALRKKDEHLSGLVSSNLKADGVHAELVAELSELKANLRHTQAELSKEHTRLHRTDGQCGALSEQNQRLEDLIQHYRSELTRRDALLNSQHIDQCNSERQRNLTDIETTELLADVISLIQKLDAELFNLISDSSNFSYKILPQCPRPGQRTKLIITSLAANSVFNINSSTNTFNITPFSPLVECPSGFVTECCFTAESEGPAVLSVVETHKFHKNTSTMKISVLVEGPPCVVDVTGSTLSVVGDSECTYQVLATLRNGIGELVSNASSLVVVGDTQQVPVTKLVLPTIAMPRGIKLRERKNICENTTLLSFDVQTTASSRDVTLDDGCCIVSHVYLGKGLVRSGHEVLATIDPQSCSTEPSHNITVGDRGCIIVTLRGISDNGQVEVISPTQVLQAIHETGYVTLSADCNTAVDIEVLPDTDLETLLFYFTPLQSGLITLQLSIGRTSVPVAVQVCDPGQDPISLVFTDKFGSLIESDSVYKIGLDTKLDLRLGFYDVNRIPSATTPPLDSISVTFEDSNGIQFDSSSITISQHPDSPAACLVSVTLSDVAAGRYQIICSALNDVVRRPVTVVNAHSENNVMSKIISNLMSNVLFEYAECPSKVTPGGIYNVKLTPRSDSLEPLLLSSPPELRAEIFSSAGDVPLLGSSNKYELVLRHSGTPNNYFELSTTAPVAPGEYRLKISSPQGSNMIESAVAVVCDSKLATKEAHRGLKGTISLIPNVSYVYEQQEGRKASAERERKIATRELENFQKKNDEQQKGHAIELAAAQEAALRDTETAHQKVAELKKKLSDERNTHKDYQSRWASREDGFTDEREQLAKDKLMWLDKIKSLTSQEEHSLKAIAQLRDERQDLQAAHSNEVRLLTQRFKTKLSELSQQQETTSHRWVSEKSNLDSSVLQLQSQLSSAEHTNSRLEESQKQLERSLLESQQAAAHYEAELNSQKAATAQMQLQMSSSSDQHTSALESLKHSYEQQEKAHHHAMQQTTKKYNSEVAALQESLRSSSEEKNSQIQNLQLKLQSEQEEAKRQFESTVSSHKIETADLTSEIELLNEKLTEADVTHSNQNKQLTSQLEQEQAAVTKTVSTVSKLKNQITDLEMSVEQLTDCKEELLNSLEAERSQSKCDVSKIQSQLEAARLELLSSAEEFEKNRQNTESERIELSKASNTQLKYLQDQLIEVNKRNSADQQQLSTKHDDDRQSWQQEKLSFKVLINKLELSVEDAKRELSLTKSSHAADIQESLQHWQTENQSLQHEVEALTAAIEQESQKHSKEVSAIKSELENVNKLKSSAEGDLISQLETLKDDLTSSETSHSRAIKLLEEEKSILEARHKQELQTTVNEAQDLRQQNSHMSLKITDLEETAIREKERWGTEKTQFKDKLTSLQQTSSELAAEHKEQLEECDAILARVKSEAENTSSEKFKQMEHIHKIEISELISQMEAKTESNTAEWDDRLATLCAAHKSELSRLHEAAAEREAAAEICLDAARLNYKSELDKMEAEVARTKADRIACRQRSDQDRANDKQQLKAKYNTEIEDLQEKLHEAELKYDRLTQQSDTAKTQHTTELSEVGRQLQKVQQQEAECQQREAMDELTQLRKAWQSNLEAATAAHDCDRESFSKERESWRTERVSLWKEREATRQSLETALTDTATARQEVDNISTQRSTEVAKLVDENALLARQLVDLREQSTVSESQSVNVLQLELQKLQSDNQILLKDLKLAREDPSVEKSNQISSLTSQVQSLREKHGTVTSSLSSQLNNTEEELNHARQLIQQLQREVTASNLRFENLSERYSDKEKETSVDSNLQQMYDTLKGDYDAHLRECRPLAERVASLEEVIESQKSKYIALQQEYATHMEKCSVETDMIELKKQIEHLNEVHRTHLEACQTEPTAIPDSDLLHKYNSLQETHAQVTAEMEVLRGAFEDENVMEKEFSKQKDKIPELESKMEVMENNYEEQLTSYKELLDGTQHKYQQAIEQQASERTEWISERDKLRKDASELRRQLDQSEDANQSQLLDSRINQLEQSHQEECGYLRDQLEKTKTCWKQEKTEFDAFLLEIDQEKEQLTRKAANAEQLQTQLEFTRQELHHLQQQQRDTSNGNLSTPPSPISPPEPVSQSDTFQRTDDGINSRSTSPTAVCLYYCFSY